MSLVRRAWLLRAWLANALLLFVGVTLVGGRLGSENAVWVACAALVGVVLLLAPDSAGTDGRGVEL